MRDIKFRAWDRKNKEWHYFNLPYDLFNYNWLDDKDRYINWFQYTGLKDKNIKKIWEADLIKSEHGIGIIFWEKETSRFAVDYSKGKRTPGYVLPIAPPRDLEIIGNIYQTPELLKEQND